MIIKYGKNMINNLKPKDIHQIIYRIELTVYILTILLNNILIYYFNNSQNKKDK
jgi:hypothetical protein